jgi:hypothetical protein
LFDEVAPAPALSAAEAPAAAVEPTAAPAEIAPPARTFTIFEVGVALGLSSGRVRYLAGKKRFRGLSEDDRDLALLSVLVEWVGPERLLQAVAELTAAVA